MALLKIPKKPKGVLPNGKEFSWTEGYTFLEMRDMFNETGLDLDRLWSHLVEISGDARKKVMITGFGLPLTISCVDNKFRIGLNT